MEDNYPKRTLINPREARTCHIIRLHRITMHLLLDSTITDRDPGTLLFHDGGRLTSRADEDYENFLS